MVVSEKLKARIAKTKERNKRISEGFPHAIKETKAEKSNNTLAIAK